jgi:hypothetical protein
VSKKRRKPKPRSGYRAPTGVAAAASTEIEPAPKAASRTRRPPEPDDRSRVPRGLGWLSRGYGSTTLFPSIPRSLGRALLVVGSSPVILLSAMLFVFLAWLGMVALGLEGPPGRLVNLAALPPISTYFDALNGVTIYGFGLPGLIAATGFMLVRSLFLAVLTGLVVQAIEGEGTPQEGALRGLRAFPIVLAVNILSMTAMIAGTIVLPFLGAGLGFLGSILILVAALFFLVYAPTAAIREGRNLQDTLRRSARAAMLPGSRHVILSMLYVFLALPLLVALAPSGSELSVNPALSTWIYALAATVLHVVFLAAFSYRWISAEAEVPEKPFKLRRR